jgi:hypothetical protein
VLSLGPYLGLRVFAFRRLSVVPRLLTVLACAFFIAAMTGIVVPTWRGIPDLEVTERIFSEVSSLSGGVPWLALALGPLHLATAKLGADLVKERFSGPPGAIISFLYMAVLGAVGTLTVVGYGTGSASLLP